MPPKAPKRGRETARDMLWSMAVVGIFVGFLVVVTYRDKPEAIQVVDPAPALEAAQALAPFEVVSPVGLPATWRPTSARYDSATASTVPNAAVWHVGYVTPTGAYASLDQAEGDPRLLVRTLVDGARPTGEGTGALAGWQRWDNAGSDRSAYVVETADSTLVVYGSASEAELGVLAASLRPSPTG